MDRDQFLYWAKENLKAAELLYDNGLYNASANRAYYAAFHAAITFLLYKGIKPAIDHKTVLKLFSNEFVNKRKVFPSSLKDLIYKLQILRNIADYRHGASKNTAKTQLKILKRL